MCAAAEGVVGDCGTIGGGVETVDDRGRALNQESDVPPSERRSATFEKDRIHLLACENSDVRARRRHRTRDGLLAGVEENE